VSSTIRRRTVLPVALLGVMLLTGCSGPSPSSSGADGNGFPVTISNCGREVTIPRPPARVVTERGTSTTVAAVGAADRIVAHSGEGDAPLGRYAPDLAKVPQISANSSDPPSRESILNLRPDLVIAGHITMSDIQALETVGVPVLVPFWFCGQIQPGAGPVSFEDIYRTLGTFGRIFGTQSTAQNVEADLRRRVGAVQQRFSGTQHCSAADLYVDSNLLQFYGRPSLNNAVLEALGLRNVFADANKRTTNVTAETILSRDPDVLILNFDPNYGINKGEQVITTFRSTPALEQLRAVRNRQLATLDYSYLESGPLAVDGLELLAQQLAALPH
jgi:iron complex transport system substrate-binding protein